MPPRVRFWSSELPVPCFISSTPLPLAASFFGHAPCARRLVAPGGPSLAPEPAPLLRSMTGRPFADLLHLAGSLGAASKTNMTNLFVGGG